MAPTPFLLYALIHLIALAHAFTDLPGEVSRFIPACAEECFLSFLDVHLGASSSGGRSSSRAGRCRNDPSLQCLCSTTGTTPFTVGEGAVQCLTAEKRFGSCTEYTADGTCVWVFLLEDEKSVLMCSSLGGM